MRCCASQRKPRCLRRRRMALVARARARGRRVGEGVGALSCVPPVRARWCAPSPEIARVFMTAAITSRGARAGPPGRAVLSLSLSLGACGACGALRVCAGVCAGTRTLLGRWTSARSAGGARRRRVTLALAPRAPGYTPARGDTAFMYKLGVALLHTRRNVCRDPPRWPASVLFLPPCARNEAAPRP